ncbi:hypothetical protein [uncultured Ruminococcus sp.]|uniref:hypothetical protein n=1 Tax=uncultured Ruminococcus sp. TaxID=165186 RepID=UPI0026173B30|nr:hypothetical protein [uncultured Ruminococcus sp.]
MKTWKKIILVTLCSLFLQLLHWVIYQWTSFPAGLLFLTPLLLCAVYHVYQSDTLENRGIRRLHVFFGGVLIPLVLSVLVSLGMFLHNPDMSLYHPFQEPQGGAAETVALYSGRMMLTSLYLLIFSGIDVLLLHLQDSRRERKSAGGAA